MMRRVLSTMLITLACAHAALAQAPAPADVPAAPASAAPATSQSPATDAATAETPSPVELTGSVDRASAGLGQTVVLTVDVSYPANIDVTLPAAEGLDFAPFEVRDAVVTPQPLANGRKVVRYTVRLAAYDTGKQIIPPLKVDYKSGDKTTQTAQSAPIPIEVERAYAAPQPPPQQQSQQPPQPTVPDIKPIKEPGDVPTPPWMYAAAGAAALAVVLVIGFGVRALVRRLRQRVIVPTTPHGIALASLDALVAANLPAQGQMKAHYERLAEILRTYLSQRFDLAVLEHTTAEVVALMRERNFEDALRTDVRLVLDEADLVKFAKLQVPVEKAFAQCHAVRTIVERTIPAPPVAGDGKPSSEATQPAAIAEPVAAARKEA